MSYTVKQVLTLPFLTMVQGQEYAIKILAPFTDGKPKVNKKTGEILVNEEGNPQKSADKARISLYAEDTSIPPKDFETIILAVLRSRIEQNFPNQGYVGKCFLVKNLGKPAGGKAMDFYLAEITV